MAKPRFAAVLRRESKNIVGSRTGFAGNVTITIPSIHGDQAFAASGLKKLNFWDADAYWTLQDRMWKNPNRKVRVSDLREAVTQPKGTQPAFTPAAEGAPTP